MAGKNEQSLLISLDSLSEEQPNAERAGAEAAEQQGIGEESGLIDLAALEGAGLLGDDDAGDAAAEAPAFEAQSAVAVAPRRRTNVALIAGLTFGALLLAGGGIFLGIHLSKSDAPAEPQAQAQAAAAPAAGRGETAPAAKPAAAAPSKADAGPAAAAEASKSDAGAETAEAADSDEAGEEGEEAETDEEKKEAATAKARPKKKKRKWRARTAAERAAARKKAEAKKRAAAKKADDEGTASAKAPEPAVAKKEKKEEKGADEVNDMLAALQGGKPSGDGGGTPEAEPLDPTLPEKLGRGAVMRVVRRNAAAVRKCKDQPPGGGGTVMVTLLIQRNGSVKSATVAGSKKDTPLGKCVERTVKVFTFPQFRGDPMRIKLPFSM